ncbi:hypothetical protein SprV_0702387100 [Sparganum proliferum]
MHHPLTDATYDAPQINANNAQLKVAYNLTYLGSTLSHTIKIDDSVDRRISTAVCKAQSGIATVSTKHQTEDVQGGHSADPAVWSGVSDGVKESGAETQLLPLQLFSTDTATEVAEPDPGHSGRNPQHLRHAEMVATALGRQLKRPFYGDVVTGPRRQGGQVRRYKYNLENSLKSPQTNAAN